MDDGVGDGILTAGTAVFSPSLARHQQHQAKEWSYVDQWLIQKYHPRPVPPFERNTETLKVLVALVAANETADEERSLVLELKHNLVAQYRPKPLDSKAASLRDGLAADARTALGAISAASIQLGVDTGYPYQVREAMLQIVSDESEVEQLVSLQERSLKQSINNIESVKSKLAECQSFASNAPKDLPAKLAEWTRTIKILQQKSSEYRDRASALMHAHRRNQPKYSIGDIVTLEDEVISIKTKAQSLNDQMKAYASLPPDNKASQRMIDESVKDLDHLQSKRDALYQKIIDG